MGVGWGIIGIGRIADNAFAPAVASAGGRLMGAWSRSAERAQEFAERYHARKATTDLDEIMSDPDIKAVYVATPNALHVEPTIKAARAGKHVLCEKPLALSVEDAQLMIESCREAGVRLGTNFQTRYNPASQETRRLVADGVLGDITFLQVEFSSGMRPVPLTAWRGDPALAGAGTLMDLGVHGIDLMRFLSGQDIREVSAITDASPPRSPLDRVVSTIFRFDGGAQGVLHVNQRSVITRGGFLVVGTGGRALGDNVMPNSSRCELIVSTPKEELIHKFDEVRSFRDHIQAFQRSIEAGEDPHSSGLEGLRTVQVTEAILKSARDGRRVEV